MVHYRQSAEEAQALQAELNAARPDSVALVQADLLNIAALPSLVAQPLSEATMYLLGIDFNINSLPVAAVGIGIGIDYGYYVLSRMVEELSVGDGYDAAIRRTFETTGKTVLFTGVSLTASIIFWVFFPMKFQAQMAFLLVVLLAFHLIGALMFIPPMVAFLKEGVKKS